MRIENEWLTAASCSVSVTPWCCAVELSWIDTPSSTSFRSTQSCTCVYECGTMVKLLSSELPTFVWLFYTHTCTHLLQKCWGAYTEFHNFPACTSCPNINPMSCLAVLTERRGCHLGDGVAAEQSSVGVLNVCLRDCEDIYDLTPVAKVTEVRQCRKGAKTTMKLNRNNSAIYIHTHIYMCIFIYFYSCK